jgi:insertion element IS1 protein InsB
MECKNCQGLCIKKGCQKRKQRYYCKIYKLYQLKTYRNKNCTGADEDLIIKLNNEGVGISGISRITGMSKSNVVKRIRKLANRLMPQSEKEKGQIYEVDELHTFVKNKRNSCYIIYALNRTSRRIIDFVVGARTKENISRVISSLNKQAPKQICTDKLNIYPGLIAASVHKAGSMITNHIERFNLTLRTHIKRLSRRTICYSKSKEMLENCLKIYLWQDSVA